ncbi:MAG TPA: nuclear transport factor 2 family protein [Acidimicrobiia bacterium]
MSDPGEFAVPKLIALYAERIDAGDFSGVAELFAHARVTAQGVDTVHYGTDEVRAMYEGWTRVHDDGTPRTKHVTTNLVVEVDEDAGTATCRSYFTVLQQTDALALQPIIAGRYHDSFERVDGTWRFAHRHMITDLVGDLSQHLTRRL